MDIPGVDTAIKSASQQGWLAVIVCIVIFVFIAGLSWLVKYSLDKAYSSLEADRKISMERETRMATRLDEQENLVRQIQGQFILEYKALTERAILSQEKLGQVMDDRPCVFMDRETKALVLSILHSQHRDPEQKTTVLH